MFYEEIFKAFNNHDVKYLVVGGVAINLLGIPRSTADLDIFVDLAESNLKKIVDILGELKFKPRLPVSPLDILDPKKRAEWINKKNLFAFTFYNEKKTYQELDILLGVSLNFTSAWAEKITLEAGSISIPVISISNLIELKKAGGRKQDISDIEALRQIEEINDDGD